MQDAAPPPFSRLEWLLAGRYLRARRKERAISAIAGFSLVGIMLGVATLIIVMSVMNGFRDELVTRILGVNAHVMAMPAPEFSDPAAAAARIARLSGVTRAAPMIEQQVMGTGPGGATGVMLRAYAPDDLAALPAWTAPEWSAGAGGLSPGGVALGQGLAAKLGVALGDSVTLISPRGAATPFGRSLRSRDYRVERVFRLGMHEYDKLLAYLPIDAARILLNRDSGVDGIEVMTDAPDRIDALAAPIRSAVGEPLRLWSWKQANSGFLDALKIERNVMLIILTLIILVAALNIISGLIMLVKDKTRDIGILRTMGLTRGAIMRVFFICGASIGVVGAALGVALGVTFASNIRVIQGWVEAISGGPVWDPAVRVLSEIPSDVRSGDVLMTLALALGLAFLATLYPAWRAARLDPVEALRDG